MISWLYLLATLTVSCMLAAGDTEGIDVNNQGRKIGEMTPEVAMDFKVIVNSYEQECYYLKLTTNDIFHFIINILKGGEQKVDILISDPHYNKLFDKKEQTFAWYDNSNLTLNGVYSVCVNNRDSYEKLAYINFISFPKGRIEKLETEHKELNETSSFMQDTISKISYNLFAASRAQTYQRIMSSRDSYTLDVNADYVQLFSVIQICVIVVSGIVQTWFIKKLFKMKSYGGH